MDAKLENLIEKLETEAVDNARKKAEEILQTAREEAEEIVRKARQEASSTIEEAGREAESREENARQALRQAARDAELLLKERITTLFDRVFKRQVGEVLEPEELAALIREIAGQWTSGAAVEIVLGEGDKERLEGLLFAGLREDLQETTTLRVHDDVVKGFRVGLSGEDVYYDFTDEGIAEALRTLLNPGLKRILDGEDG